MIFNNPPKLGSNTNQGISKYLQGDMYGWFINLLTGLGKISFGDNFETFQINDLSIVAGETATITNVFKLIPSGKLILRQSGNGLVTDGVWDSRAVRLINNGPADVTVSVIYFK
jgi:hypothetical protein